jgi:hypothetical protein
MKMLETWPHIQFQVYVAGVLITFSDMSILNRTVRRKMELSYSPWQHVEGFYDFFICPFEKLNILLEGPGRAGSQHPNWYGGYLIHAWRDFNNTWHKCSQL